MQKLIILTILLFTFFNTGKSQCFEKVEIATQGSQMQFISDEIGFCNKEYGSYYGGEASIFLYKTENAGKTWKEFIYADRSIFERFYFIDKDLGFIFGRYTIARTENGGQTFTAPVQNNNYSFLDMYFVNRNLGWATSYPGNLWKTINSGKTWIKIHDFPLGSRPSVADKLYFFNENKGFLLKNRLWQTNDGGISWTDTGIWSPTDWQKIGDDLLILTREEIITYNSSGQIKSRKYHFFHPYGIKGDFTGLDRANFFLTNTGKGYYTSTDGVWYTKDNGSNWSQILTNNTKDIFINQYGKGTLFSVDNTQNYYYDCPLSQHDKDFYDRCYYAFTFDAHQNSTIKINNKYSRDYYSDMFTVPIPSCWTISTLISKPYWLQFEGNNSQVKLAIYKESLKGVGYCKAALYKGDCHNLEIVDCGQIDFFSNKIEFKFTALKGIDYYILIDPPNDIEFTADLVLNQGATPTNDMEDTESNYIIYPNPASQNIIIPFNYSTYSIMTVHGKILQRGFGNSESIDISSLQSGLYILQLFERQNILISSHKIQKM